MIKRIQRGLKCFHKYGPTETLFKTLHYFHLVSVYHALDFFIDEAGNEFFSIEPVKTIRIEGDEEPIHFRELRLIDLDEFIFESDLQPLPWIKEQFKRGSRLFTAVRFNTVIAVNWANTHYANLDYIQRPLVRLPSGIAYTHGSLTSHRYKKQKIASRLKRFAAHTIVTTEQRSATVGAVFTDNEIAQRWHWTSLKSKYWGRIHYLKWGMHEFWVKRLTWEGKKRPDIFDLVVSTNEAENLRTEVIKKDIINRHSEVETCSQ